MVGDGVALVVFIVFVGGGCKLKIGRLINSSLSDLGKISRMRSVLTMPQISFN